MKDWMAKNKIKIMRVLIVILYICLLAPYLFSIYHAVPTSDDFCMTLNGEPHFTGCLAYTKNVYLTWSGEFIFFFLQYFINPLAFAKYDSFLYGGTLCFFFMIFILSFRYFIKSWLECVYDITNRLVSEGISILMISILLFANNYHEIFYWYIGATYELEYAIAFIAIGSMIRFYKVPQGKLAHYIILICTGVVACNAVNMCVIIGASYVFIVIHHIIYYKKKAGFRDALPLILFVIMGCVTVFAPGNFARKSANIGSPIYVSALRAFSCNIRRLFALLENNTVFFLFFLSFIIGIVINCILKKKIEKMWSLLVLLGICLYGTLLPVAIGYGESRILNNRVCYLLDTINISILEIFILGLGMCVSRAIGYAITTREKVAFFPILICIFYAIVIKDNGYGSCEYINQISNFSEVKEERELWIGIYDKIYNSEDVDVIVAVSDENVVRSGVIKNPELDEEAAFWINSEIRRYFKKESISVILNENQE